MDDTFPCHHDFTTDSPLSVNPQDLHIPTITALGTLTIHPAIPGSHGPQAFMMITRQPRDLGKYYKILMALDDSVRWPQLFGSTRSSNMEL